MKDSEQFLIDNTHLVSEHTASKLCIFSIDLQVEEKIELMERVSHQVFSRSSLIVSQSASLLQLLLKIEFTFFGSKVQYENFYKR